MTQKIKTVIGTDVNLAAQLLQQNEVVAIPTETVYGLAANALSEEAVQKIFTIKQRPRSNPLIIHLPSWQSAAPYVQYIQDELIALATHFSPGPLTLLLPKTAAVPEVVNDGRPTVAVRVPNHPLTLQLLQTVGFPLAAPSANLFGYISPTQPDHVYKQLGGTIPYILDGGPCAQGIESTVAGFEDGQVVIYRLGAISFEAIEAVIKKAVLKNKGSNTVAPGMLPYHYSPVTPLYLVNNSTAILQKGIEGAGFIGFDQYHPQLKKENQILLSPAGNMQEAAANLYKAMHQMDDLKLQVLYAQRLPNQGLGQSINDRLHKAAAKTNGAF